MSAREHSAWHWSGTIPRQVEAEQPETPDWPDAPDHESTANDDLLHISPAQDEDFASHCAAAPPRRWADRVPQIYITQYAHLAMVLYLSEQEPEAGGLLLGPSDNLVTHFVPDERAVRTSVSFRLDAAGLNKILKKYRVLGLTANGIVHSHPAGCPVPSCEDLRYVRTSFANPRNAANPQFFLPIFSGGELHPYLVLRHDPDRVRDCQLLLI